MTNGMACAAAWGGLQAVLREESGAARRALDALMAEAAAAQRGVGSAATYSMDTYAAAAQLGARIHALEEQARVPSKNAAGAMEPLM